MPDGGDVASPSTTASVDLAAFDLYLDVSVSTAIATRS